MNDLKNKYIRVYTDNLDGLQTFEGLCTGVGDGFIYLRSRSGFDQCFLWCVLIVLLC